MATKKRKKATTPLMRDGRALAVVQKGDRRRLSDARNAWRKMTPEQRREFLNWLEHENLKVVESKDEE